MNQVAAKALDSMYAGEPQRGFDNELYPINGDTLITREQGMWLYRWCLANRPKRVLEVGMAYGYSTLYLAGALADCQQKGTLDSIDPFQMDEWRGIGLSHTDLFPDVHHCWHELRSDRALARLATTGDVFELIFIDGDHKFDGVLLDFTLAEHVLAMGGIIVLHDAGMPATSAVRRFIMTNRRDFKEIATAEGMCAFMKVTEDKRGWDHYQPF